MGVTSNLARRIYEHRMGWIPGFTSQYGLIRLVLVEEYQLVVDAIRREKAIKHWPRAWKVALIEKTNPEWTDLYASLL